MNHNMFIIITLPLPFFYFINYMYLLKLYNLASDVSQCHYFICPLINKYRRWIFYHESLLFQKVLMFLEIFFLWFQVVAKQFVLLKNYIFFIIIIFLIFLLFWMTKQSFNLILKNRIFFLKCWYIKMYDLWVIL